MFPNVTGNRFLIKKSIQVISAPSNIPKGIKNMLATLCSNPNATNAVIGIHIPKILPLTCFAATLNHIAKQTSQLQAIAFQKSVEKLCETLDVAILWTDEDQGSVTNISVR